MPTVLTNTELGEQQVIRQNLGLDADIYSQVPGICILSKIQVLLDQVVFKPHCRNITHGYSKITQLLLYKYYSLSNPNLKTQTPQEPTSQHKTPGKLCTKLLKILYKITLSLVKYICIYEKQMNFT